jgi:4'-phosphopantetheinyl transferase EntD
VLERFSLKESFFKAVNRVVGPRISFQAVEITAIADDGTASLQAAWLEERGFLVQGWLGYPEPGFILSSVHMRQRGVAPPSQR